MSVASKERQREQRLMMKRTRKEQNIAASSSRTNVSGTVKIIKRRNNPLQGNKTPSVKKLYMGGPNPITKAERIQFVKERVAERKAVRALRSHQDQLDMLDRRLGTGQGAVKERARLKALIDLKSARDKEAADKRAQRKNAEGK